MPFAFYGSDVANTGSGHIDHVYTEAPNIQLSAEDVTAKFDSNAHRATYSLIYAQLPYPEISMEPFSDDSLKNSNFFFQPGRTFNSVKFTQDSSSDSTLIASGSLTLGTVVFVDIDMLNANPEPPVAQKTQNLKESKISWVDVVVSILPLVIPLSTSDDVSSNFRTTCVARFGRPSSSDLDKDKSSKCTISFCRINYIFKATLTIGPSPFCWKIVFSMDSDFCIHLILHKTPDMIIHVTDCIGWFENSILSYGFSTADCQHRDPNRHADYAGHHT